MKLAQVEIESWKPLYEFKLVLDLDRGLEKEKDFEKGDYVQVFLDSEIEIGRIVDFKETDKIDERLEEIKEKASESDLEKINHYKNREFEARCVFREIAKKYNLPMKVCHVHFAFSGKKITFVFSAEARVDFTDILKDLTNYFQKPIKLEQIGARDEARQCNGLGVCGREICCAKFLKTNLPSVSKETIKVQGLENISAEKITGRCGRLRCCLAFESATKI